RAARRAEAAQPRWQVTLCGSVRTAKNPASPLQKTRALGMHLRDRIILRGDGGRSLQRVYSNKTSRPEFDPGYQKQKQKPEMIGHDLGELSITHKPGKHSRPGIRAAASSFFDP
ncbi:40S ribosomal protein S15, partial [Heterocephalus glaber]